MEGAWNVSRRLPNTDPWQLALVKDKETRRAPEELW
jgi:hypothetical protein